MADEKLKLKTLNDDIEIRSFQKPEYDIYDKKLLEEEYEQILKMSKNIRKE